jgi:hypothetical protein
MFMLQEVLVFQKFFDLAERPLLPTVAEELRLAGGGRIGGQCADPRFLGVFEVFPLQLCVSTC